MATLCRIPAFHKLTLSPLPSRHTAHSHYPNIPNSQTSIFASINKPRVRKPVKSNADLCNDIREFLSMAGLPQYHVPTTKELTQHGRQDLANIVRRRGYKFIRELLNSEEGLGQDEKMKNLVDDVSSFSKAFVMDGGLNSGKDDGEFNSHRQTYIAEESSIYPSLLEKASNFIQNGELDSIEDSGFEFLNQRNFKDVDGSDGPQNAEELRPSTHKEQKELVLNHFDGSQISNGKILSSTQQLGHAVREISLLKNDYAPAEEATSSEDKGLLVKTQKEENQADINHLKFMLHQKELELTRLKQQIEEEKRTLSALQAKAETEIRKAQKLISEKDAELNAAEESLSGLKEVEIQYEVESESVEVAGSFNGWHHKIKMDPQLQASSSIIDPSGVRKCRLWRTVLWLYPGIYEIKFVVDGHWRTDPDRELVTRGAIENNVLRVER
nr:protein PTST homolog 3, chloroplastic isoform X1 [Ipomoea batatas]